MVLIRTRSTSRTLLLTWPPCSYGISIQNRSEKHICSSFSKGSLLRFIKFCSFNFFLESLIFKESILFSCIYYSLLFLVKKLQLYRSKQLNYINTIYLDAFVEYKQNLKHIKKIKLKQ